MSCNALACSCLKPDLEATWNEAAHIFIAEITDVRTPPGAAGNVQALFRVAESIKGHPETVEYLVGTSDSTGAACAFEFRVGERYLVVADDDGRVSTCSGSARLDTTSIGQLYATMNLAYFRARAFDEKSECTYSRAGQINELIRIRDMNPDGWEWRPVKAEPTKGTIEFEDNYGQRMVVTFSGCDHLAYAVTLRGLRPDLSDSQLFAVALQMVWPFWGSSELEILRAGLMNKSYEIENSPEKRTYIISRADYLFHIILDSSKSELSVSYSRNF